jgi:3D (Asp-Asp-Asp) domain-containing protein
MFVLMARALCGMLVLAGFVSEHRRVPQAEKDLPRQTVKTGAADVDRAQPEGLEWRGEYLEAPVHRICRVTAYCDRGLTAAGVPAGIGQCAAPADIPFGARVYIPALDRTFIVTDRTAKRFRHNTVDIFMPGRDECLEFGCQYLECEITLPVGVACYGSPRLSDWLKTGVAGSLPARALANKLPGATNEDVLR